MTSCASLVMGLPCLHLACTNARVPRLACRAWLLPCTPALRRMPETARACMQHPQGGDDEPQILCARALTGRTAAAALPPASGTGGGAAGWRPPS